MLVGNLLYHPTSMPFLVTVLEKCGILDEAYPQINLRYNVRSDPLIL